MTNPQIVTISFFNYQKWSEKWWAFKQMGLAGPALKEVPGLQFSKLLGSGGFNGFSIWPNFGTYGLLGVWQTEAHAEAFFTDAEVFRGFKSKARTSWTVYMRTTQTHGQWDGQTPFIPNASADEDQLVAVITRATIYPRHLWRFWRFVPPVSHSIENKKGLIFAVGIGELPLIQQATFSLWESTKLMKAYAYESGYHKKVVRKTREIGWYKEELFARFLPYRSEGSWNGTDPLRQHLAPEPLINS